MMMRRLGDLALVLLVCAAAACGGGGSGGGGGDSGTDTTPGDGQLSEFCLENPGAECDDDDPCTLGMGICISGECAFDETTDCGPAPDSCSSDPVCDGEGGCIWVLSPGWCRIDGECRQDGETSADNACLLCDPDEGRTSWTPASGTSCIPEANPCTDSGTCQEGFCVPDAVGVDCASDADCSGHDDGNLCNGLWTCVDCECTFDPGSVVACQGEDSECAALVCEPATGTCIPFLDPDGTGCDDGDPCTTGDACLSGECQPGEVSIPVWTPLAGPDGLWLDMVVTLPGSPSTFLAVGRGGAVFRSLDAGQSWERGDLLGWGEERGDWLTVAHGTTASILVIYGGTLFRSLDGGIQWSELMDGCAAVTECAAVPGTFVAACNGKTWLSQDGGATFAQSGGDLPGGGAEVVALAARDVATWHVGTRNEDDSGRGRVYRTTDGGNSWGEVTLPGAPDPVAVSRHGLLVHPSSPDRVFAGLSSPEGEVFLAAQAVLFRSADTGVTWETLAPTPMGASMVPLTLDSIGRLLVGADRSLSRGGNFGSGPWAFIPGPPPGSPVQLHDITQVLVDPANEFSFYVPAANGLAYAKELGQLWTVLTGGLRGGRFNQLLVTASGSLLAAEPDGGRVVRSSDGGHTWAAAPLSLTGEALVLAGMAESPGGRLFGVTTEGGLVRSDSGGADWIHLDPDSNPLFTPITSVAAPTPPGEGQGRVLAFLRGVGLWINDNGAIPGVDDNWSASPLPVGEALSLVPLLGSSTILFLGTAADPATGIARIWRSTSGGDFWSQVASGQGDGFLVFAHPGNSSMAYAALLGKNPTLYQTTNSGGSWAALPKQLTFANVRGDGGLLADPAVPEGLYAAFWLSGVWRFDPAAAAWARLEGSPRTATTLAVDASTPGRLLAGDGSDAVLWASDDQGASWAVEEDFGGSFTRVRKVLSRPAFTVALLDGDAAGTGALRRRVGGTWLPAAGLPGGAWDVEGWEDPDTGKVVLLAAGEGGGLYQSLDGGASWAPIETWPGTAAWDLEVIGAGSTILATSLCGLETSPWAPAGVPVACGVIRSDDGGETWAQALTLERPCAAIGLDPAVPAQAWAACPGSGLYQTSNAGLSWQNVSSGVGLLSSLPLGFTDVTITGGRLALGSSDSGVFMTLPGSTTTWVSAPESMPRPRLESIRIHADSENGNRILLSALPGGLYVTWNGGTHWHDISGALTPTAGWADRLPLQASFIHAVDAPSPAFGDGVHVWAAVEGAGLWKATPDLWSWSRITTNIPAMDTAHPLALSEAVGGVQNNLHVWLAATEGVIRTTSAGQNWQTVGTGLPPGDLLAFAPPTGGPNLFASVSGRQIFWESFDGAAWAKSETLRAHGRPWPLWPGRRVGFWSWMAPHPTQGARVHLSLDPTGLWSTMDGGLTWDPSGQGLPPGGTFALLRDLDAPESLFVGTTAGVWLSNDGEEFFPAGDWEAAWGTPMELYQDPGDGDRLFAITEPSPRHGLPPETAEETLYPKRALVRSTDRGATWEPVSGGVPENSGPLQVLADPLSEDVYYLATASEGILRSLDGGLSWEPWTIGLPGPRTGAFGRLRGHPMSFSPSGDRLYLGTSGFGIWERVPATGCE